MPFPVNPDTATVQSWLNSYAAAVGQEAVSIRHEFVRRFGVQPLAAFDRVFQRDEYSQLALAGRCFRIRVQVAAVGAQFSVLEVGSGAIVPATKIVCVKRIAVSNQGVVSRVFGLLSDSVTGFQTATVAGPLPLRIGAQASMPTYSNVPLSGAVRTGTVAAVAGTTIRTITVPVGGQGVFENPGSWLGVLLDAGAVPGVLRVQDGAVNEALDADVEFAELDFGYFII